jgi:hypothetical protein
MKICRSCCSCNWTVTVKGCGGAVLPNATVSISGGPSGTTNSSGQVTLTGVTPGASATVSKSRFVSQNITVPAACASSTVNLAIDTTNYVCSVFCADPLAKTLHLTDNIPVNGGPPFSTPVTLTYNGTNYVGTATINYNDSLCAVGAGCPSGTVTFTYTFYPQNNGPGPISLAALIVTYPVNCPVPGQFCPTPGGACTFVAGFNSPTVACPPTFSATSFTSQQLYRAWCNSSPSFTITE